MAGMMWEGIFRIIISTPNKVKSVNLQNMITDAGLNYMASLLDGTVAPPTSIEYIALGDGTTAPASTDTKLVNERFRKRATKQEITGTGAVQTTCYVAPYEANFQIEEIGVFAGPTATSQKDSGVMIARVLWSHLKSDVESLQIVRVDTIGRA